MPRNIVREQLNHLWDAIVLKNEIPISRENEIAANDLIPHNIICISWDFETLDQEEDNLRQTPPILFYPLPAQVLAENPIDPSPYGSQQEQERALQYYDFNPPADEENHRLGSFSPISCGVRVSGYVKSWALGFPRPTFGVERVINGPSYMRKVSLPNPLLLGPGWTWFYPSYHDRWSARHLMEFPREAGHGVYPHVTACLVQDFNARDNILLYSELAAVIAAMRNRANQPKVDPDNEDAQEALLTKSEKYIHELRREFPMEKRFPVLILSFVGPQHARFLYACMDRRQLVIRQSQLYSFVTKSDAALDLFARFLLSRPLSEQ
ncbi:hypothetical protein P168DRAFT_316642 [Aspergillus campestris IBT 28561]|uniref:Uncharacterized protein n=1 Tax=Aspergillus campestris (strain IBT 28561) TaxID=1392248 RepID=A0A2I1D9W5_ASPC2|nr:uncharacterized protein P168DRAFT_316642 [Aspergillus campestris IBT 28561]PKY06648.1 hypothetical protein P168DRAFT_316642 [Aspergillus campestris IBT 28561]